MTEPEVIQGELDLAPPPQYSTERLLKFATALSAEWKEKIDVKMQQNRNLREVILTQDEAAASGLVDDSETFIGMRVVDENILRETPLFLKYMEGSARQLAFIPINQEPGFPAEVLEAEFTRTVRYSGWQIPFYVTYDSASLHGSCCVEVIMDPDKTSGLAVEYIEYNCLLYPLKCRNLQYAECIMRRYTWSACELKDNAKKFNLNPALIERLTSNVADTDINKMFNIYKIYYRDYSKGTGDLKAVHCAWYADDIPTEFLREPYIHTSGKFNPDGTAVPSLIYPFMMMKYRLTENIELGQNYGRATLDEYSQEGQTRLMTNYVNATTRASNFYPSLKNDPNQSTTVEVGVKLKPNHIMLRALDVFSLPYPEPVIAQAIALLKGYNLQSAGQTDYAATNRKDSRKTATEIQAAQQQAEMMSGVSMFTISQFCLAVFAYQWDIIRHNALFFPQSRFLSNVPEPLRTRLLAAQYNLRPAGDIDFVERQEKVRAMMQYWPVIQQTPAALPYLKKLISVALPNEANEIISSLGDPKQGLAEGLVQIISQVPREQLLALFPPESQQQMMQILDEVQKAFGGGGQAPAPQQPQPQ